MRRSLLQIFVIAFAILAGCSAPVITTNIPDCTIPSPQCKPGTYSGNKIDTGLTYPGYQKYYIELLPSPFNTNANDNAISFWKQGNDETALISSDRLEDSKTSLKPQKIFSIAMKNAEKVASLVEASDDIQVLGTPYYCEEDGLLYFSAKAKNDDPNDYDLFIARITGSGTSAKIESISPLTTLNKEFSFDSQPTLSRDGKTIFFASDRPGGYGGVDVWYSERSSLASQNWSVPAPCSAEINTPCDELSPSFSLDGKTFYFSSNGHSTIGGYDIFFSTYSNHEFSKPENFGSPVNTSFDELFPFWADDSTFYYVSNQTASFSGRNIFALRRTTLPIKLAQLYDANKRSPANPDSRIFPLAVAKEIAEAAPDTSPVIVVGKVRLKSDSTKAPDKTTVFWRDTKTDKELGRKPTDERGNYSLTLNRGKEYDLGAESKDKLYDIKRLDLRNIHDSVVTAPMLDIPDTLLLRINFPFDDYSHPYDFTVGNDGKQTPFRWSTLIDLIAQSIRESSPPIKKLVIIGHTDYFGGDSYNMNLSTQRAEFVADELIRRGIDRKLLKIIARGKTQLLPKLEGESDETFRLRCRRIEFVKIFQ
jgi:hypothetical protein